VDSCGDIKVPEELQVLSVWQRRPVSKGEQPVHFMRHRHPHRCSVDDKGLEGSDDWNRVALSKDQLRQADERTLLVQCQEHYPDLGVQFPEWADHFDETEAALGEQLVVSGMNSENICVGDVFASDHSTLEIKVSFPRLPCFRVDKRYPLGQDPRPKTGQPGTVRQWIAANGKGGFFCSVRRPGDVADGDTLKLVQRPCPDWTLKHISNICYPKSPMMMTWQGDDAELKELTELEELGYHEWKERLIVIRASLEKRRPLMIPDWLGTPMMREEGEDWILGLWKVIGCSGGGDYVELVISEDNTITSTEPLLNGADFAAKVEEEEEEYTLDVQIGDFSLIATMNGFGPAGGRALLVFSNGCIWSRVGKDLDCGSELSIRSSEQQYPSSLSYMSLNSLSHRSGNSRSTGSKDRKYKPATISEIFFPG